MIKKQLETEKDLNVTQGARELAARPCVRPASCGGPAGRRKKPGGRMDGRPVRGPPA